MCRDVSIEINNNEHGGFLHLDDENDNNVTTERKQETIMQNKKLASSLSKRTIDKHKTITCINQAQRGYID